VDKASVDLGFINFVFSLKDVFIAQATSAKDCQLLSITEEHLEFSLCHLQFLNITTDEYTLVSDPPLFTDIGFNYLSLADLSFDATFAPVVKEGQMTLEIKNLDLNVDQHFDIEGVSDMAKVVENTVNTVVDLIYGRFRNSVNHAWTMVKQDIEESLETLFKLPRQMAIDGDVILADGSFLQPEMGAGYASFPLTYHLDSAATPNAEKNDFQMPMYNATGEYQMQLFMSEYGINSALYVLHTEGLLGFSESELTNTTFWGLIVPEIEKTFGHDQKCTNNIMS